MGVPTTETLRICRRTSVVTTDIEQLQSSWFINDVQRTFNRQGWLVDNTADESLFVVSSGGTRCQVQNRNSFGTRAAYAKYRKAKRKQIMTSLQTVYISDPTAPAAVNGIKQASAFPPNFIHSLDGTHMMLTALECRVSALLGVVGERRLTNI